MILVYLSFNCYCFINVLGENPTKFREEPEVARMVILFR